MKKYADSSTATEAIQRHIAKNPLLHGDGYCLNDRFAEDYAYADATLKYVYAGTLDHMSGMRNDWPSACHDPLLLPLNEWLAIVDLWGTAGAIISSGALSAPRVMWQLMGELIDSDGAYIPETVPEENAPLNQLIRTEVVFLRRLWDRNTNLFGGTLALAVKSIVDKGDSAPLLHWLCYLSISAGAGRTIIDAMLPPAETYVCMNAIYKLINE